MMGNRSRSRKRWAHKKRSIDQYLLMGNFSTCAQSLSVTDPLPGRITQACANSRHRHPQIPWRCFCPKSDFLFSHGLGLTPSARLNTQLIWQKTRTQTTSTFPSLAPKARTLISSSQCQLQPSAPWKLSSPLFCGPLSLYIIFYNSGCLGGSVG